MRDTFTPSEAARIVDVNVLTLDGWERRGIVRATNPSRGLGAHGGRRYSFRDLVRLRAARELRDQGVPLAMVAKIAKKLGGRRPPADFADTRLVVAGGRVFEAKDGATVEVVTGQAAFGFVLDLGPLVREVKAAAKRAAA